MATGAAREGWAGPGPVDGGQGGEGRHTHHPAAEPRFVYAPFLASSVSGGVGNLRRKHPLVMPQTPERMHPGGGRAEWRGDPPPRPAPSACSEQTEGNRGARGVGGTCCPRPKASLFSPHSLHTYCEKGMQVLPGLTLLRFHMELHCSARESQKQSEENAKLDIPSVRRTATSSCHFFTSENSTAFTDTQTNTATYTRPGDPGRVLLPLRAPSLGEPGGWGSGRAVPRPGLSASCGIRPTVPIHSHRWRVRQT